MRKLAIVIILLVLGTVSYASPTNITINERDFRATIADDDITVTIPIISNLPGSPAAQLKLELLDSSDKVIASTTLDHPLNRGRNVRSVVLAKPKPAKFEKDISDWYRIRYSLIVTDGADLSGIVALDAINPQAFTLSVAYPSRTLPGSIAQLRVHTANPATHALIAGVQITAKPDIKQATPASGITNSSGDALLKFRIPETTEDNYFNVNITGNLHGVIRDQEVELRLIEGGRIVINTDKLLYQPGQSLHARAMAFDDNNHAIANESATLTLRDPDDQLLFQSDVKTNTFGIASADWELPDSIKLGEYELEFEFTDRERPEAQHSSVRISRYNLPSFTVEAKPDRTYYLPGQNAEVTVNARYLFGKDLTAGKARLVIQEERHWDSSQKKYITAEGSAQELSLDRTGHAVFKVDLTSQHADFKAENYQRFRDLNFSAYVTDPTTGKIEQRRLKLRITHDPIHVYIADERVIAGRSTFFISTYYADGVPAECTVDISEDPQYSSGGNLETPQYLRTVKTNRFGLAKVTDLKLLDIDTKYHQHRLLFSAHDKRDLSVTYADNLYSESQVAVVSTDKSLYQAAEPITVTLYAPEQSGHFNIEAIHDGKSVWSGRIGLRNHRGFTTIPANLGVQGELTIAAYSLESVETNSDYEYRNWAVSRTVLFPHPTKLDLKLKTDRGTYRPGDPVTTAMNVSLPGGGAAPTALGVVVVDKAVEERIRTDQEFGEGHYGFWNWSWWYRPTSVGGVTRQDLDQLDLSQPLPDGLDLVAELILSEGQRWDGALRIEADDLGDKLRTVFLSNIDGRLTSFRTAVTNHASKSAQFPTNMEEFDAILKQQNISLSGIKDPWDQPFHFTFGVDYRDRYINIVSTGPDKKLDTADDISAAGLRYEYFSSIGNAINRAISETYTKSGSYILDFDGLRPVLLQRGLDLSKLSDPWGNPYLYSFRVDRSRYQLVVSTHGPDFRSEPFAIWTSSIDYFTDVRKSLDASLAQYTSSTGKFPQTDADFDVALSAGNNNFRSLRDPWGNAYYLRYYISSGYSDTEVFTFTPGQTNQSIAPVTLKTAWIEIWSSGPDGKLHTNDDFDLSSFSRLISEQSGQILVPAMVNGQPNLGNSGAIQGIITDPSGAAIPNVIVTATAQSDGQQYKAKSGESGAYLVRNLPPGLYDVKAETVAFRNALVKAVPVHSSSLTQVNITLQVGTTMEMVEVSAEAVVLQTTKSAVSSLKQSFPDTKVQIKEETFTPRVRDFFPETLYWAPSVITDANGHAKLNFKLADNITTWKMSVIASTKDGQIGAADTEIQAFQPFFAELDPPKILTVGDFIELPVVVRNYLPTSQQVGVEMKPSAWFELQKSGKQQITIAAGDSTNAIFPFRAITAIKNGKQQVSAANRELGDAIEKPVSVHPDGLEQSATVTDIVRVSQQLQLALPANIIPGSIEGQLKIYPNLISHVAESIEAGLHRPYGCGEQTVSSTYPSLLLLQFEKATGLKTGSSTKATHYLDLGLRRLISYRANSGGFSYWGHGEEADVALTAYAIRFLNDASQITNVDPDLIPDAVKWLVSQQQSEGSWKPHYSYPNYDNSGLTAYIALSLSALPTSKDATVAKSHSDSVQRAFQYLADPHRSMIEPYALAEFALLADRIGQREQAATTLAKLRTLGVTENKGTYWSLERNTPFYAWGHTGRIESTAMALLALATLDPHPTTKNRSLLDSATLYLLQQKDRYGIWYSGQATINVLKALLASLGTESKAPTSTLTLTVNGRPAGTVSFAPAQFAPSMVDISSLLRTGDNEISVTGSASVSTAQAVASYYVPWTGDAATEATRTGKTAALRLAVNFDRKDGNVGDTIKCIVNAERIGSRGWGMMIAEIGLPPGADIDRDSLNKVIANSGWTISRYDVLPDRLQVYLWPRAGGSQFKFTFRPRFGLKARTAPSQLYDYYNPEAEVSLAPADFTIRSAPPENNVPVSAPGKK